MMRKVNKMNEEELKKEIEEIKKNIKALEELPPNKRKPMYLAVVGEQIENLQVAKAKLQTLQERNAEVKQAVEKADWSDFSKDKLLEEYSEETQADDFYEDLFNEFVAKKILQKLGFVNDSEGVKNG